VAQKPFLGSYQPSFYSAISDLQKKAPTIGQGLVEPSSKEANTTKRAGVRYGCFAWVLLSGITSLLLSA
jgi:hypothetical protein